MSNKVIHFEIPANDFQRATRFYEQAFGWKMNTMTGVKYALVSTVETDKNGMPRESGAINGGILERQEPIRHPVITINVKTIDAAAKLIAKNGGKMVRERRPVGTVGFAAYFEDPEGNIIGLWEDAPKSVKGT